MAQISYEEVRNDSDYKVGFFALKHDGDEAIVRILCDSLTDLDIMTVHPITVGQSSFANREVSCLRTPKEPLDKCPLCQKGEKVKQRVYIKLLRYDLQTREIKAEVWNRPAGQYVPQLKSYLENYGPLSQIMCKIVRHGSGLDTKYDIIPNLNPQQYTLDAYPIDLSDFEEFSVLGSMVYDKTASEMMEFIRTGNFPQKQDNQTQTQAQSYKPAPQGIPNGYQQPYAQTGTAYNPPIQPTQTAQPVNWDMPAQVTSPLNQVPSTDPWGNPMEQAGGPAPMNVETQMGRPQRYQ